MFNLHLLTRGGVVLAALIFGIEIRAADITPSTGATTNRLVPDDRSPTPKIAPASNEAETRIKQFKIPAGFKVELFAAEPMLANPVAFTIDEQMRFYVSETHRYRSSVLDIRHYMFMLEDDLASRTVEDRASMLKKNFGTQAPDLARETEIIRLIEDRDGDGKADHTSVFADGFNTALDGIASGVIARKNKVWFTNIPELWQLDGPDADGKSTGRRSLSHGYGVHFSLTGHDLHGLRFGPDGRLYFTIGDRGANIVTKEGKKISIPDEGGTFRCQPDGTELELFARGQRNPQELAFDNFGNLFTGDNDADLGDHERWVYVVEGGDSGWRIGYQNHPLGNAGPWNSEKLWVPHFDGQAAYIVPPIANILDGPSGLTHNPGTGFPASFDNHFFLCYFKGTSARSGIQSYSLTPSGASFTLNDRGPLVWNCLPTDCEFGYDGCLYFTDWNEGWEKSKKGRIYRLSEPGGRTSANAIEVQKIFAAGFEKRSLKELLEFLKHPDQRVRQEAQFALVEKGPEIIPNLSVVAGNKNNHQLSRLHAIWGLGQLGRKTPRALDPLLPLLTDKDGEVRAQSAKVLGEARDARAFDGLVKLLADESLRVRFFAAMSLGKIGKKEAVAPVLAMLADNADQDQYLRHAGVMALVWINDTKAILAAGQDINPSLRLAACLALRKLESPQIAMFLQDVSPRIVEEAARAINDVPINAALPLLAAMVEKPLVGSDPFMFRVVNANFRTGYSQNAGALARIAARSDVSAAVRAEALFDLANWAQPPVRDRIVGVWRPPLAARDAKPAAAALRGLLAKVFENAPLAAARTVAALNISEASPALAALVADKTAALDARLEALKTLESLAAPQLPDAVKIAQAAASDALKREGNRLAAKLSPGNATAQIAATLRTGSLAEKQGALATLGGLSEPRADELLATWLDQLLAGTAPKELQLELLEAAAKRAGTAPAVKAKLKKFDDARPKELIGPYLEALHGGNADAGKKVFMEKVEASCVRCHKIGNDGAEVGPVLTGIGQRATREQILESIVAPNAKIAAGFESVTVTLNNGTTYAGLVKGETADTLEMNSPEDGLLKLKKPDIKSRNQGLSGMPEGVGQALTKEELRDLVEFLAGLK